MSNKLQVFLGVGALAVAGYLVWKNQQSTSTKKNLVSKKSDCSGCYYTNALNCYYSMTSNGCPQGMSRCCAAQ